jgi:hypothetical protein
MASGIVDQNMDSTKFELGFLEQIRAGIQIGHIHRDNLDPGFWPKLFGHAFESLFAASDEHEVGARIGKSARGRRTYPLRSTGDDDGFVFEVIVHRISLVEGHYGEKTIARSGNPPTAPNIVAYDSSGLIFRKKLVGRYRVD